MKTIKQLLFTAAILAAGFTATAQVGVNTETPAATLDVVGDAADTSEMDGIIAPRLTGDELRAKTYAASQTGAMVYVTAADSAPAGQTVNVTEAGYYHFDGTEWVKMGDTGSGKSDEPWFGDDDDAGADSNTEDIYHMGNVGVGLTSPNGIVDINAPNENDVMLRFSMPRAWQFISELTGANNALTLKTVSDSKYFNISDNSNVPIAKFFANTTDSNKRVLLVPAGDGVGRVGIGIDRPLNTLHINGPDNQVRINDNDDLSAAVISQVSGGAAGSEIPILDLYPVGFDGGNDNGAVVRFFRGTNPTAGEVAIQILRANNTTQLNSQLGANTHTILNKLVGNVGIGNITPEQKLHVGGNTLIDNGNLIRRGAVSINYIPDFSATNGADASRLNFSPTSFSDGTTGYKYTWRNDDGSPRIDAINMHKDGKVAIGTSNNIIAKFTVAGDIKFSQSTAANKCEAGSGTIFWDGTNFWGCVDAVQANAKQLDN